MLQKTIDTITFVYPLFWVYPRWAQILFVGSACLMLTSVLTFAALLSSAKRQLDPSRRPLLPEAPYATFDKQFRHVVAAYRIPESGSLLHVVWGDLGAIRDTTVVLPVSQSFDLQQRGPKSVLAAFNSHAVCGARFYDHLDKQWPQSEHPPAAGIGTTKHLALSEESHGLRGVIFVVTTRNLSIDTTDYGLYKNTPVASIDYAIEQTLDECVSNDVTSVAMPLIGAGYANIGQTLANEELKHLVEHATALITIDRLLKVLSDKTTPLRRGTVVIYSKNPHSEQEDTLWESAPSFIRSTETERKAEIDKLLKKIKDAAAQDA